MLNGLRFISATPPDYAPTRTAPRRHAGPHRDSIRRTNLAKQTSSRVLGRSTNAFIFQARLNRFDLRTELKVGVVDTWEATRYRLAMRVGDVVYFWLAGPEIVRGIYGWGQIKRAPYKGRGDVTHSVDVLVQQVFSSPLLVQSIRKRARVTGIADSQSATGNELSAVRCRSTGPCRPRSPTRGIGSIMVRDQACSVCQSWNGPDTGSRVHQLQPRRR
jgi:hypothetical protein